MKPTVQATLNIRVPMRDGIELATHVYLPSGDGPFPVVFVRTPYEAIGKGAGVLDWPAEGYAYVAQDVRGCFLSEGEFYAWMNEASDGADALEWIAAQTWCNGNITMYGGSYLGATQVACALSGNPALKCVTPALIGANRYHTAYWGGAFRLKNQSSWVLRQSPDADREALRERLPLGDYDTFIGVPKVPYWQDSLANPYPNEFWNSASEKFSHIQAPAFIRSGWYDLFVGDTLELFNGFRLEAGSEAARQGTRIIMGPWPHNINQQVIGEVDYGPDSIVADLFEQEKAFLAHYAGLPSDYDPSAPPLRIFVMGINQWRDEHEWPLARTVWTDYFLGSGGQANTAAGDGVLGAAPTGPADEFSYDPANPVPTTGGAWDFTTIGSTDQAVVETRPDVLVYTSAELESDLEVTGPIKAHLFASSSAVSTDFTAKLVDVHPDGRAMSITDGIVRTLYRNPEGPDSPLEPGEVYEFVIQCCPTSMVFKRGHRLRLEVSSSNFPAFSRNLNTGEDLATGVRMEVAKQTIHHSETYPSRLILPIINS